MTWRGWPTVSITARRSSRSQWKFGRTSALRFREFGKCGLVAEPLDMIGRQFKRNPVHILRGVTRLCLTYRLD